MNPFYMYAVEQQRLWWGWKPSLLWAKQQQQNKTPSDIKHQLKVKNAGKHLKGGVEPSEVSIAKVLNDLL